MKYVTIAVGIAVLTLSLLAWTSKEHFMQFGTFGSLVVIIFALWKSQYLRKHPKDKQE